MRQSSAAGLCVFALCAAMAALSPAHAGSARLARASDGHYWADARIEGRSIRVLVDTGASLVALCPADARRLGLNPHKLDFIYKVRTANGETAAAKVKLRNVEVGATQISDVDALVIRDGLDVSILGMSFLGRLTRLDLRDSEMRIQD